MKVPYNKLVRDRMPEIIRADGHQPVTRILDQAGYRSALVAKLLEEAQEASAAPAGDLPAELADVLEVTRMARSTARASAPSRQRAKR
jgi:predicted house-cleaning noncanonical NTP pyrophosphatase (MazG superfamily)